MVPICDGRRGERMSGTMHWMPPATGSMTWRAASTWAAAAATVGAACWWGLLGARITGLTRFGGDDAMSRLFVVAAIGLSCVAVPTFALAIARRVTSARGLGAALVMVLIVLYLFRLAIGHAPASDAGYRGSNDTTILLVAAGWTFIVVQLWRLRPPA